MEQIYSGTAKATSGTMTATQPTCSTAKVFLFITILTAISLAIPLSAALEIELDSPKEAELNKEFTVKVSTDSEETFDIKVFVHKSDSESIKSSDYISEIYDAESESWKNPWYYLKEYFPDQEEYEIKVTSSSGKREICARLREPNSKEFYTECNNIKVIGEEKEDEDDNDDNDDKDEEEKDTEQDDEQTQTAEESTDDTEELAYFPEDKITLNSKPAKPLNPSTKVKSKGGKISTTLLYGFTGFCILVLVLLALRKL